MSIGSKEFREYCEKAHIPKSYRIWAAAMWREAQKQALNFSWISVKDDLPDHEQQVWVYSEYSDGTGAMSFAIYDKEEKTWFEGKDDRNPYMTNVKYWMPLPNNPVGV